MKRFIFLPGLLLLSLILIAQPSLRDQVQLITASVPATVGVAIRNITTGDTLSVNGSHHYPMQSVFKFPLAMAVLHEVDQGKLSLTQKVTIKKSDYLPMKTHSPMAERFPEGNVAITLQELLAYTVSLSDNNTCDILIKLLGGPKSVQRYIHSLGVTEMAIVATEEEMHRAWDVQYMNWTTPTALTELLKLAFHTNTLSSKSRELLWKLMVETRTGPNRLKAKLPADVTVAHKTGTSGKDNDFIAAVNDTGIMRLPNGQDIAIAVLVSDSHVSYPENERVIAGVAEAVYNSYHQ
jgi:beta-lactamase class A